jgi:nickel transport protein
MKKIYVVLLLTTVSLAYAHRVNIFTQTQGEKVICQCFYNDGKPVRGQSIQVKTLDGTVIAEGKTDDEGMFSFSPNIHEDLKVILNAGMGHVAETIVKQQDLPKIEKKPVTQKTKQPVSTVKKNTVPEPENDVDEAKMREVIEQVIEEKLQPVIETLQQQQRSYSLTTIIGGIGYIVGIFGLFMFWKSRKRK